MTFNTHMTEEMDLLLKFDPDSMQHGLKVHSDAAPALIAAAARLHDKGLIDEPDGGFLTSLGHEGAEHARALHQILQPAPAAHS
ncbi:MAG: TIGR02647 family protein [Chromatocurvus sp.]